MLDEARTLAIKNEYEETGIEIFTKLKMQHLAFVIQAHFLHTALLLIISLLSLGLLSYTELQEGGGTFSGVINLVIILLSQNGDTFSN